MSKKISQINIPPLSIKLPAETLKLTHIFSKKTNKPVATSGEVLSVCTDGCLVSIHRDDFLQKKLLSTLNINCLINDQLFIYLSQMNLDLDCSVKSTKYIGNKIYHLFLSFSEDTPLFWRECFVDLCSTTTDMTC